MPDSSANSPQNWRELAEQARTAAENLSDPVAWARMIGLEEACKRLACLSDARQHPKSLSRISRLSGGVW
jgi:hypothetical protein